MEKILANVGPLTVTEREVDELIVSLGARGQSYNNPEGRRMILEQLIGNKLLLLDARRNLLEAEPEFKAELARLKENLLINYAGNKAIASVTVSESEVREYYEANADRFTAGEVANADHILVDTEEKALDILAEIKSGAISFEDAAKQYSSCPSGQRGGNLGEFGRGQMVPEFDEAIFTMEVGSVTETPVKTQFGYHLIRLNSREEAKPTPFGEIREQLTEMLLNEKRREAYSRKINQLKILYPVDIL